jgi:hypothetical protein
MGKKQTIETIITAQVAKASLLFAKVKYFFYIFIP